MIFMRAKNRLYRIMGVMMLDKSPMFFCIDKDGNTPAIQLSQTKCVFFRGLAADLLSFGFQPTAFIPDMKIDWAIPSKSWSDTPMIGSK